ncbi:MAG TPA: hypothetical protein VLI06_11340 [Solimonas sp.]|nr:hypothetical protein [Solimonas sp.]
MSKIHSWLAGLGLVLGLLSSGQTFASCDLAPTGGTETRNIGDRSYTINVPAGLGGQVPLLLSLHGAWGSSSVHEASAGWTPFAAQKKFIVAYPQGAASGYWDLSEGSPEVAYLREVVADISSRYCIDPGRIYVDGHSRGSVMSQRAACDAGDLFAAATGYAGPSPAYEGHACHPSRPIAVGIFGGDLDPIMLSNYDEDSRDFWLANAGCNTTPHSSVDLYGRQERYTGCSAGMEIWFRVLSAQSHEWPLGPRGSDLRNRMWTFLMLHRHPGAAAPGASQPGVDCTVYNPLTWVACSAGN